MFDFLKRRKKPPTPQADRPAVPAMSLAQALQDPVLKRHIVLLKVIDHRSVGIVWRPPRSE